MGQLLDALRGIAMPEQKRTQMSYLDKEIEAMKSERDTLKLENRDLRAQVKPLEEKVKRLEAQVKELTSKKEKNVVHEELDDVEKSLLSFLASMKEVRNRTPRKIAEAVGTLHVEAELTELKVGVYLKRLEKRDFVRHFQSGHSYSNTPEHWDLEDRGAEYVVLHKLEYSKASASPGDALEVTEIEMMKFIGSKRSVSSDEIQKGMELTSVAAEHFLARLLKAKLLEQHAGYGLVPVHYALSNTGNEYLVEKKLVPIRAPQMQQPDNPKGHRCDHCGSVKLRRSGSRTDPTFGDVGVKQALYDCLDCQKQSGFTNDESSV